MAGNSKLQQAQRAHWQLKGDIARMRPNVTRLLNNKLINGAEANLMQKLLDRAEARREAQWVAAKTKAKEAASD